MAPEQTIEPGRTEFTEAAVRFPSADGSVQLAGTLLTPSGSGDFPVGVLVSGTGPIDRDVTFVGHQLFRVLAHSLAKAGIGSLRFDKRGVGESEGDFSSAGPDDFIADVRGAVNYLVNEKGYATERVGLIGHSEGGAVALSAATRLDALPFCVVMASPLLSGKENVIQSFALLARASLERDETYDRYVSELRTIVGVARLGDTSVSREDAIALADGLAPRIFTERTKVILGSTSLSGAEFFGLLASNCLETVFSWEPEHVIPRVTCPVLFLYGTRDVQVPAAENLAAARTLIKRLGKENWMVLEMSGLNHAFQRCTTGMPDEYEGIDHVMADDAVEKVSTWIQSKA